MNRLKLPEQPAASAFSRGRARGLPAPAGAAWLMIGHDSGYPEARRFEQAIAFVGLALFFRPLPVPPLTPALSPEGRGRSGNASRCFTDESQA